MDRNGLLAGCGRTFLRSTISAFGSIAPWGLRSIQPTGNLRPLEHLLGQGARLHRAATQDLVNVVQVRRELRSFGSSRSEVIPVMLEQRLLQIAVAQSPGAQ